MFQLACGQAHLDLGFPGVERPRALADSVTGVALHLDLFPATLKRCPDPPHVGHSTLWYFGPCGYRDLDEGCLSACFNATFRAFAAAMANLLGGGALMSSPSSTQGFAEAGVDHMSPTLPRAISATVLPRWTMVLAWGCALAFGARARVCFLRPGTLGMSRRCSTLRGPERQGVSLEDGASPSCSCTSDIHPRRGCDDSRRCSHVK
jgi:hypothetical protein